MFDVMMRVLQEGRGLDRLVKVADVHSDSAITILDGCHRVVEKRTAHRTPSKTSRRPSRAIRRQAKQPVPLLVTASVENSADTTQSGNESGQSGGDETGGDDSGGDEPPIAPPGPPVRPQSAPTSLSDAATIPPPTSQRHQSSEDTGQSAGSCKPNDKGQVNKEPEAKCRYLPPVAEETNTVILLAGQQATRVYHALLSYMRTKDPWHGCNPSYKALRKKFHLRMDAISAGIRKLEQIGKLSRKRLFTGQRYWLYGWMYYDPQFRRPDGKEGAYLPFTPEIGRAGAPESGSSFLPKSGEKPEGVTKKDRNKTPSPTPSMQSPIASDSEPGEGFDLHLDRFEDPLTRQSVAEWIGYRQHVPGRRPQSPEDIVLEVWALYQALPTDNGPRSNNLVRYALKEAIKNGARSFRYVQKVLQNALVKRQGKGSP